MGSIITSVAMFSSRALCVILIIMWLPLSRAAAVRLVITTGVYVSSLTQTKVVFDIFQFKQLLILADEDAI